MAVLQVITEVKTIKTSGGASVFTIDQTFTATYSKVVQMDVQIASGAAETSYKPAGISTINYIMVTSLDNAILLRTVAAGSQYSIPGGGSFLVETNTGSVTDLLLTGNGSTAANIQVVIAMT